ncbi:MAG: hypothetical protein QOE70_6233 [Chthoniobacter sp.]|jgi:hypothetical protein|nr:hypothetical protein [Chthoniobacter sp.]
MNYVFAAAFVCGIAFPVLLAAQDAAKPARKTLSFPPGATTPAATPGRAAKLAATPASKPAAKPETKPAVPPADASAKTEAKPADPNQPPAETAAVLPARPPAEKGASPAVVTSTVPPEPAQIVHSFFQLVGMGEIDGAYTSLMKGSKIAERPEELRSLKLKTQKAVELFGVVHGYDLVDNKPVGERLMRATYVSLGHDFPLRWRFYFYKSQGEWKLIDLRVDDNLPGIFDELGEPRNTDARP